MDLRRGIFPPYLHMREKQPMNNNKTGTHSGYSG